MAAAGSAIGLGNLWKFPYMAGTNGGALFLIFYIIFLLLLGIPILLSEMAVGRFAGLNAADSCSKIKKGWGFVGGLGIFSAFTVLAAYSVVGGWVMKYILCSINGEGLDADFFAGYTSDSKEQLLWTAAFIFISAFIVTQGVSKGIEKVSSVLLPVLFVFLVGIMIYSLTLPGAKEGVRYFIVPGRESLSLSEISSIAVNAMGQVFFSLSLGMGTLITYGSYLPKSAKLTSSTFTIVGLDTLIAVISGFTIIPAVFSLGLEVTGGPGLIFQTLPAVFAEIPAGRLVAALFFTLVLFAAITSSISLMEVIVSWLTAKTAISRYAASVITAAAVFIPGFIAVFSFGAPSEFSLFGMNFFDFLNFFADKVIMPIGGFFICILVGYIWGIKPASTEISNEGQLKFSFRKIYTASIKYISPVLIVMIFISSFL